MNEIIVSRRQIIEHNRSIRYELNICIMQTDKLNLISVSDINEAFVLGGLYLAGHQGTKERLIMKRIILASNNKDKIKEIVDTKGVAYKTPWFGQLMTGPQLMAYLCQVNMWLEKYQPKIEI